MGHESRSRTETKELDFSEETKRFLRELFGESIGSPSASKKLDAIIEILRSQANVAADLALVKDEISTIHGLLADLVGADPEKIKEITDAVRSVKEKLKSSVDSQTKGDY